ncbi:hypothetical protein AZE42_09515 [Rhizopogon vesiculosus]|uniref:Uncharacterized protein n=1 Tax=Rhizopogon vesiculosus TaxID=180088 RepID=A0A1J8R592_9AGAM|nr:hypothetical protein AZE42_09515 [Rhizopogon vesiculosus]
MSTIHHNSLVPSTFSALQLLEGGIQEWLLVDV